MKTIRRMFTAQHSPDTVDDWEEEDASIPIDNTCTKNDGRYRVLCDIQHVFEKFLPENTFFHPAKDIKMEPAFAKSGEKSVVWNEKITEAIAKYEMQQERNLIGEYRQIPLLFYMSFSYHSFVLLVLPPLRGGAHSDMFSIGLKLIASGSRLKTDKIAIVSPDINPFKLLDAEPGARKGAIRRHNFTRNRTIIKAVEPLTRDFIESFEALINAQVITDVEQDAKTKIYTNMTFSRNRCLGRNCSGVVEEFSKKSGAPSIRSSATFSFISRPIFVQHNSYTHAQLADFLDNIIRDDDDKAIEFLFRTQAISNMKAYGKFRKNSTAHRRKYLNKNKSRRRRS